MRTSSLLLAATLLLAGCSDATGPTDDQLIGMFELTTVDGDALPVTVFDEFINDQSGGFQLRIEVLGGTIEFFGDHEYEQLVDRRGFADNEQIALGRFIDRGTWVRGNGNEIVLESDLYENLTTVGTRDGSVIILEQDLSGEDRTGGKMPHRFAEVD